MWGGRGPSRGGRGARGGGSVCLRRVVGTGGLRGRVLLVTAF